MGRTIIIAQSVKGGKFIHFQCFHILTSLMHFVILEQTSIIYDMIKK